MRDEWAWLLKYNCLLEKMTIRIIHLRKCIQFFTRYITKLQSYKCESCGYYRTSLRWRHNGRDGVSNHQPHQCLLNRLFEYRSKKTSKLRVTGLCVGNSPGNSPHKCQSRGKCFHLMTSSCCWMAHHITCCISTLKLSYIWVNYNTTDVKVVSVAS